MFQNTGTGVPVFNPIRGGLAVMYAFFSHDRAILANDRRHTVAVAEFAGC
jgi:hypothetical protein